MYSFTSRLGIATAQGQTQPATLQWHTLSCLLQGQRAGKLFVPDVDFISATCSTDLTVFPLMQLLLWIIYTLSTGRVEEVNPFGRLFEGLSGGSPMKKALASGTYCEINLE